MENQQGVVRDKGNLLSIQTPIQIELVRIPAGEFLMGSDPTSDKFGDRRKEQPQHLVYLDEYFIAKYPITNSQYDVFLKSTDYPTVRSWRGDNLPKGKESHPVTDIAWNDAMAFVSWLSKETDQPFRLPSEAEWEKAARGLDGRIFPWGNEWDPNRVSGENVCTGETTPVGSFSPQSDSPYKIVDMAGNTFEYCNSAYKKYPYVADDGREDQSAENRKVIRGGPTMIEGWWDVLRCAVRHSAAADKPGKRCGFRVAMSVK